MAFALRGPHLVNPFQPCSAHLIANTMSMRHPRFLILFALLVLGGCRASGPSVTGSSRISAPEPVAVINGEPLTQADFEEQYARALSTGADSIEDRSTFLDRYVNYRLKVLEARRAGYADIPEVEQEIQSYRSQLARPYLVGQEVTDPLVRQLYERRKEAVQASHILVSVDAKAPAEDTLRAWSRITALRDSALSGADFGQLARQHSEDPSSKSAPGSPGADGNLGYFGGGRMVQPFEDYAYDTPVGGISPVFRTRFGYHILKVEDRKPLPPARELAHIMIQPRGPSPVDSADALRRVNLALERLDSGEAFSSVAADLSDDRNSAPNGGNIGLLGFDQGLPPAMRDSAFALPAPGAYSGPAQTRFGYHIMSYIREEPLRSLEDEYETLKQQISNLPRAQEAETAFARSLRTELGDSIHTAIVDEWVDRMPGDSLYRALIQGELEEADQRSIIATLGDSTWTVSAFQDWFRSSRLPAASGSVRDNVIASLNNFLDEQALAYEVARLEDRNEDFRRTMAEFRDGILLFRLMEDSVWSAAASDSSGLRALYDAQKDSLMFPDRVEVVSMSAASDSVLFHARDRIRGGEAASEVFDDMRTRIRVDTTHIAVRSGSPFDDVLDLNEGEFTEPSRSNGRFIMLRHNGVQPARHKTYEEARSELINLHQANLEAQLMDRLRKQYGVETWPDRLRR